MAYLLNLKGFLGSSPYRIATYEGLPSQNYPPGVQNTSGIIIDAINEETRQLFEFNQLRVDPDPTKMGEPCAIFGQTFQPRSKILYAAHGVYIIDSGW